MLKNIKHIPRNAKCAQAGSNCLIGMDKVPDYLLHKVIMGKITDEELEQISVMVDAERNRQKIVKCAECDCLY